MYSYTSRFIIYTLYVKYKYLSLGIVAVVVIVKGSLKYFAYYYS